MIPYTAPLRYSIFGLKISPESIATTLAFTILLTYVYSHLNKQKIYKQILKVKEFAKFTAIMMISSLTGGRAWYYFITKKSRWGLLYDTIRFLDIRKGGGQVSAGMVLGGIIGLLIYIIIVMKKDKNASPNIIFSELLDILAPGAALYIFIYRIFGCSIQGLDVIGTQTTVPWALFWIKENVARHPTSFYLALSGLFIFLILRLFFGRKKTEKTRFGKRSDGEIALWFLLLYCFNRFIIEFFRVSDEMYGKLNLAQWICLVAIVIASYLLGDCYYTLSRYKINSYKAFKSKQKELLKLHSLYLLKETIKKIIP